MNTFRISIKCLMAIFCLFVNVTAVAQEKRSAKRVSPSDSTKSGYKADATLGNAKNPDVEMELNDYTAPAYRWELRYSNGWFNGKRARKSQRKLECHWLYERNA